jgi:hypothetical protein
LYLLFLAVLCHEAFVADVGEEKSLVDGDVCGILVGGGVGGAHVGVPFPTHVGFAALLLVVLLLFLLPPLLVVVPVTITIYKAFSDKMTGLTEREMCPWAISISILVIRCPTHYLSTYVLNM